MQKAAAFAVSDGGAAATALLGFLARGGIVLLLLPSVVLPSVINIAGITGVDAISIAGQPTPWFLLVITGSIAAALIFVAIAALAGSVVDCWLVRMAMEVGAGDEAGRQDGGDAPPRRVELPGAWLVLRLAAIRVICLIPLAIALAWAATQIFDATYNELITPTNLATPLPVRVILAATDAVVLVAAVWLAGETLAAIAVRRALLDGGGIRSSLVAAAGQIARRPLTTLLTAIVSTGVSALAIGLALALSATAFDWCRIAARSQFLVQVFGAARDLRPITFALAAVALALAWIVALAVSAVTSAWRSAAFTAEAADARWNWPRVVWRGSQAWLMGLPGEGPNTSRD